MPWAYSCMKLEFEIKYWDTYIFHEGSFEVKAENRGLGDVGGNEA